MNEADTGVELRVASQALFHAWHSDQNQAETHHGQKYPLPSPALPFSRSTSTQESVENHFSRMVRVILRS
jgi:hypothetical protein